jgi:protein associated with RNAse G/E
LDYVDLDIDVIVWDDSRTEILDMDEFESNAVKYRYPETLIKKTLQSLDELLELIDKRQFPFNIQI